MNGAGISDSVRMQANVVACGKCGSTSRVGRGSCLSCLLQRGLETEPESGETLDTVLAEVDVRDGEWRLGNYQILEEIGRGGMGVIYRARQRHSRRIVALKRVLGYHADSRETLARFRREAQAAASLDHPNILPIYEVSEGEDGLPFFSMKFAPGGNLQEMGPGLRDEPRRCVALIAKIARAVQYAHGQGILHRDLKPGNILLDAHGEPLVSDFGLAKWLDTTSDLTRTLTIFGTPGYIAPEQASGSPAQLQPAADVYSLGAILFDLLAGRPPFLGSHALSVIRQAAETSAPKLRSLSKVADRDLETICARCLEREPSARYQSAHDLAEDLERWLEGRPIIARPVSPPVRVWRWSRRNPKLGAIIIACLALGIVATIWQIDNRRLGVTIREDQLAAHSIAILPFLNLDTADADREIGISITDVLSTKMRSLGPSRVALVPSTMGIYAGGGSVDDVKRAGEALKTRTVLSGTKRKVNGTFRIAVRLMNSATGAMLWSHSFDSQDLVASGSPEMSMTARAIYSLLDAKDLLHAAKSEQDAGLRNETARDLIVAGRELYFRGNVTEVDRSIGCFEKALAIEPHSAIAHAYLAAAAATRTQYAAAEGFLDRADAEAREALRLDPDSADAHRSLAGVMYQRGKVSDALDEYLRAIEVGGPEERVATVLGVAYKSLGRPDRALSWLRMARHWQTRRGEVDFYLGDCWFYLGADVEAQSAYQRGADLHPEMPQGWLGLCHLQLLEGKFDVARNIFLENGDRFRDFSYTQQIAALIALFSRNYPEAERLYGDLAKKDAHGGSGFYGSVSYQSALGWLRLAAGDDAGARKILEQARADERAAEQSAPNDAGTLYQLAAIESTLGNIEPALAHLRHAIDAGWIDHRSAKLDPRFDAVRGTPEFQKIISQTAAQVSQMRLAALSQTEPQPSNK